MKAGHCNTCRKGDIIDPRGNVTNRTLCRVGRMLLRRRGWAAYARCSLVIVVGLGAQGAVASSNETKPAGAPKAKITNWADPRPTSWAKKYPLFAPVAFGDGSLERVQDAGEISVCAQYEIPPYGFKDLKTGKVDGIEPRMFQYLSRQLGVARVKYVNVPWQSGIPAVQAKKCDAFAQGLSIRADRESAPGIKFTTPYLLLFDTLIVRRDSEIKDVANLRGKTVTTLVGSTDEHVLRALIDRLFQGDGKVITFRSPAECYQAVVNKTADAAFGDIGTAAQALKQFRQLHKVGKPITLVPTERSEYERNPYVFGSTAVVTRETDRDLNRALSIAIQSWITTGQQRKVLSNWGLWAPVQKKLVR
jgi:ABC-type amino acid transport substrate-binding protein